MGMSSSAGRPFWLFLGRKDVGRRAAKRRRSLQNLLHVLYCQLLGSASRLRAPVPRVHLPEHHSETISSHPLSRLNGPQKGAGEEKKRPLGVRICGRFASFMPPSTRVYRSSATQPACCPDISEPSRLPVHASQKARSSLFSKGLSTSTTGRFVHRQIAPSEARRDWMQVHDAVASGYAAPAGRGVVTNRNKLYSTLVSMRQAWLPLLPASLSSPRPFPAPSSIFPLPSAIRPAPNLPPVHELDWAALPLSPRPDPVELSPALRRIGGMVIVVGVGGWRARLRLRVRLRLRRTRPRRCSATG